MILTPSQCKVPEALASMYRGGLAIGDTGEIPGGPTGFGPVQYIHVNRNSLKAEYARGVRGRGG